MKNRNLYILFIVTVLTSTVFFIIRSVNEPKTIFSQIDMDVKNISTVEVSDIYANQNVVLSDADIKQITSTLMNLDTTDVITSNMDDEKPLYSIYISNNGYYPGPPIVVFEHRLEYQGKVVELSNEESQMLEKLLEEQFND